MTKERSISIGDAKHVAGAIGLNFAAVDLEQFRRGIEVELENFCYDSNRGIEEAEMISAGRAAMAHLRDLPDYYTGPNKPQAVADDDGMALASDR